MDKLRGIARACSVGTAVSIRGCAPCTENCPAAAKALHGDPLTSSLVVERDGDCGIIGKGSAGPLTERGSAVPIAGGQANRLADAIADIAERPSAVLRRRPSARS